MLALLLSVPACSLMLGEGFTGGGGPAESSDAEAAVEASGDAGGGADADASDEPGGSLNLAPDPGFEGDSDQCSPVYGGQSSTLSTDTTARNGTRSCRVCSSAVAEYFTLDPDGSGYADALDGQVFLGEAWVRKAPGGALAPTSVRVVQRVYQGGSQLRLDGSNAIVPTDEWQKVDLRFTAGQPGRIELYVEARPATGMECFLVDDLRLVRER